MKFLTRATAVLTVGLAAVMSLVLAPPQPIAAHEKPTPHQLQRSWPERLPADWTARVLPHLASQRLPMRARELETLLQTVDRAARRFRVDPLTILAVIHVESRFDPLALSHRDAFGLMQLRVGTAQALAADLGLPRLDELDLYDPELNVMLGTYYLSLLMDRFGDLDTALAAYNAGPTRIQARRVRTGEVPLRYPDWVWDTIIDLQSQTLA
jgi:soluble lytic murein transglycosylase-like protein